MEEVKHGVRQKLRWSMTRITDSGGSRPWLSGSRWLAVDDLATGWPTHDEVQRCTPMKFLGEEKVLSVWSF